MCGLLGLASNTLRFQTEKRDVPPQRIMAQTCLVKVNHSYEFHQSPNKSLRPSLDQIYQESISSDLKIVLNQSSTFHVNKCIVAVRSAPLARLIINENSSVLKLDREIPRALFELMLKWLYSSSVQMPSDIFQVAELFFLAYDFQVLDLMSRCENEIVNKLSSTNIVQILLRFYPARDKML